MHDVEIGGDLELLHREMRERAGPDDPYDSLPGLAFAYAMNSRNVVTGSDGETTRTFGVPPTIAIGVKSRTAS